MQAMTAYLDQWRRCYIAIWELSRLTDRELAELGVQRWEIPCIAYETAAR